MYDIDVVTVFHNEENYGQFLELQGKLEPSINLIGVDNREINRGFSKACNLGTAYGAAPIVGFLNPDVEVHGPFVERVKNTITDEVVICGHAFGKPRFEIKIWGCREWVCGAAMFVQRKWFESVGGFDERYVWSWEETDLIRQAEAEGKFVKPLDLPLSHTSPTENSQQDSAYKNHWFDEGQRIFESKWKARRVYVR